MFQRFLAHTDLLAPALEDGLEAVRRPERQALAETHKSSLRELGEAVTGRQQLTHLNHVKALQTAMSNIEPSQPAAENAAEVIR
jgi:hypothetical protein